MSTERLWLITVAIGFSALLITAYFVMTPMTNKDGFMQRTDGGLINAIDKFKHLKDEKEKLDNVSPGT